MDNYNNQNSSPNPAPPPQPMTTPPQPQAQNQAATGLESQPNMTEDYTPDPTYQNTALPTVKWPIKRIIFTALVILIVLAVGAFFLFYFNKGTLTLTVSPSDAAVSIDGAAIAKKQAYKIKLAAGEHTLTVDLQDHVPYNNKVIIGAYKNFELNLDLKGIPTVQKLSDEKFEFIATSPDGKYIIALGDNGKTFYKMSIETDTSEQDSKSPLKINPLEAISEKKLGNIIDIIWNPKNTLAILKVKNERSKLAGTDVYKSELEDGVVTTWLYDFKRYDLENQEITYLGSDLGDVVWAPDGNQIIYYNKDNRSLYEASPTNATPTLITKISKISDPQVSISPDKKYLSLVPRLRTYQENFVHLVDLYSKETKQIVKEGNQRGATFSPNSSQILYTTYTEDPLSSVKSILSITDLTGENNQKTNIQTLIENISFVDDDSFVYSQFNNPNSSELLKKYNIKTKQENSFYFNSEDTIHFNQFVVLKESKKIYFLSEGLMYSTDLIADDYQN